MEHQISQKSPAETNRMQLARVIELLEKIERHYNPPFWKVCIRFLFTHIFTLLALSFLAYATWKIWGVVDGIETSLGNMYDNISTQLQNVKFW